MNCDQGSLACNIAGSAQSTAEGNRASSGPMHGQLHGSGRRRRRKLLSELEDQETSGCRGRPGSPSEDHRLIGHGDDLRKPGGRGSPEKVAPEAAPARVKAEAAPDAITEGGGHRLGNLL